MTNQWNKFVILSADGMVLRLRFPINYRFFQLKYIKSYLVRNILPPSFVYKDKRILKSKKK
jgi:hypothetical protein